MPRPRRKIETADEAGDARCKHQIREVLAYGRSVLGGPAAYGLTTRDDWGKAWVNYADDLVALLSMERPGSRPVACYVMGLIPVPTPKGPVAADAPGFDIVEKDGSVTHFLLHDPASMGCEARFLFARRVIDIEELREHERSSHHKTLCQGVVAL